jgi:hypothetical protein
LSNTTLAKHLTIYAVNAAAASIPELHSRTAPLPFQPHAPDYINSYATTAAVASIPHN